MDWKKLNPWNWFKHEEGQRLAGGEQLPVKREEAGGAPPWPWQDSHPLWRLHQEVDRLLDDLWRGSGFPAFGNSVEGFRPALNVASTDEGYEITLEAPGLDVDDISIEQVDDRLIIRGEKHEERESRERHYYRVERRYGHFQRVLSLPDDADRDRIEARMQKGVLTLRVPRTAGAERDARRIEISRL